MLTLSRGCGSISGLGGILPLFKDNLDVSNGSINGAHNIVSGDIHAFFKIVMQNNILQT